MIIFDEINKFIINLLLSIAEMFKIQLFNAGLSNIHLGTDKIASLSKFQTKSQVQCNTC